jgi:phage protein D
VIAVEQTPSTAGASAFASELQLRVAEAEAALAAAESMDDPLLAQIAESDLADLRSLAVRNDVELGEPAGG